MTDPKKKPAPKPSWGGIRKELNGWETPALLTLVKDLYETSAANRDFIHARCLPEVNEAVLEKYRRAIIHQFFPPRGIGKLKLGEARKAIRDYGKATKNISGTAELLMTYVENGAAFTHEYGDIDERFYSSIESALHELATLLRSHPELYPTFSDRLDEVEYLTGDVGWGFHDYVADVVGQLESELHK
ncbi:MAG: hypothetical protein KAU94_01320 [Verrucomicrobia bacterium]|nr:hypothetical protein [Verrucomicrobiota bacterium]